MVVYPKTYTRERDREWHDVAAIENAPSAIADMFLLAGCDLLVRYPPSSWFSHYPSLYVPGVPEV